MLAIGSIVYLKDGAKKMMILNRAPVIEDKGKVEYFDYSACFYPMGLNMEEIFYFNEENIDKVVFDGYSDDEEIRFQELLNEAFSKNDISKGNVDVKN
ncbi:hypothetical protein IGI39_000370 [Enterococcus sp. AZ135]|uniref:DUF4176 domain-containing protein n=1 Tax=unclassified Enterococcus TaxID=2608891 RepID=UPI003F245A85